jgi:Zn-finger nucleic acid-binding protein
MSSVGSPAGALMCPRCGLKVRASADGQVEHCPRCLARTSGAMSIQLVRPARTAPRSKTHPRDAIVRLARRVRTVRAKT